MAIHNPHHALRTPGSQSLTKLRAWEMKGELTRIAIQPERDSQLLSCRNCHLVELLPQHCNVVSGKAQVGLIDNGVNY